MKDFISEKDWHAFLESIGKSPNDFPPFQEQEDASAHFFNDLHASINDQISQSLELNIPSGLRLGNYEILSKIGQGGMGVVYKAKRADGLFDQEVAIKFLSPLKTDDKHRFSFNRERKLLAALDHAYIAKIFDGGITTEGLPYLVMEYVEGDPIDQYFSRKSNISVNAILDTFLLICSAVQHAHNNLIIHRDLKPANILVDKNGQIKLLDFGVSGILSEEESNERLAGTAKYLSPEQVLGQSVSIKSDIYQLGILLYELLTGEHPIEGESLDLVKENILKGIAKSDDKINPKVSADLSSIVQCCLSIDPMGRYSSIEMLRSDVQNFLQKKPVEAFSGSWVYTFGLYVRRNVVSVSLITLSLILAIVVAVISQIHAQSIAQERDKLSASNDFLLKIFDANDPDLVKSEDVTAFGLLKESEKEVDEIENPEVKAYTQIQLGKLYKKLGLWEESGPLFKSALSIYTDLGIQKYNMEVADIYQELSGYFRDISEYQKADSLSRMSISILENERNVAPVILSKAYSDHSKVLHFLGKYEEGEKSALSAIKVIDMDTTELESLSKSNHTLVNNLSSSYNYLSSNLRDQSRFEEALEASLQAVRIGKLLTYKSIRPYNVAVNNLAIVYSRMGKHEKQIEILSDRLQKSLEIYDLNNPVLISTYSNLGTAYYKAGQIERGDSMLVIAYNAYLDKFGPVHNYTVSALYNLANSKYSQEDYDQALIYYKKVLEADIANFGEDHPYVAGDYSSIGLVEIESGNYAKAEELLEKSYQIYFTNFGENHHNIAYVHSLIGTLHKDLGNTEKARVHLTKAVTLAKELLGEDHERYKKYAGLLEELED